TNGFGQCCCTLVLYFNKLCKIPMVDYDLSSLLIVLSSSVLSFLFSVLVFDMWC
ncbi:hypothetical protein GCK32_010548, partial [Trichostrongylus colubriformis]